MFGVISSGQNYFIFSKTIGFKLLISNRKLARIKINGKYLKACLIRGLPNTGF